MKRSDAVCWRGGINVCMLSYRDWALPVVEAIALHPRVNSLKHFSTTHEYRDFLEAALHFETLSAPGTTVTVPDLVIYCGWSDEPVKELVDVIPHVGVHCAESDVYSAGSPLQNQVMDGIKLTKHRVFKVGSPELSLRLWSHEVPLDISGRVEQIFLQLTSTSILLFNAFLDDWPYVSWKEWPAVPAHEMKPRRTPGQSVIKKDDVARRTTRELYDFFRCLEDPYPNGCIEDEHGQLFVERVRYRAKAT